MGHVRGVNQRKGFFMVEWHTKSKRKPSGGMRTSLRKMDKKLYKRGGVFAATTIAAASSSSSEKGVHIENRRMRGGKLLQRVIKTSTVNVSDGKKMHKAKVIAVALNEANRLYTRRNIITKGAIVKIQVDSGERLVKITSRPGQDGAVNAVFWEGQIKIPKEEKKAKTKQKDAKEPRQKHEIHEKMAPKEHKPKEK